MIRALLFASILVAPLTAHAGPHCGGGGGGDHRGGGGSSSSSGGDSRPIVYLDQATVQSTTTHDAPVGGCIDDTDVVGYRHCTKFGVWANNMRIPRIFIELGSNVRQFSSRLGAHTGTVSHGAETFTYRMVTPESDASIDTAMTTVLRVGVGLPHGLYTGIETELGGIAAPRGTSAEMMSGGTFGTPNLNPTTGLYIGVMGVGGVRATTRRGNVAFEGAGGMRAVEYRFDSRYHNCEETATILTSHGVVEARARAELFLGPWITFGATLGTSLVERDDWLAGVYLGIHSRAFAGGR